MPEQIRPGFGDNDGYHCGCYQRFTMNISRLKAASKPSKNQKQRLPRRGLTEDKDKTLFLPNCIFLQTLWSNWGQKTKCMDIRRFDEP